MFKGKSLDVAVEYFIPWREISSSVPANTFGPGFPPGTLSGVTKSDTNAAFLPNFAFIMRNENSPLAFHAALLGTAGFGVDYPASMDFSNLEMEPSTKRS